MSRKSERKTQPCTARDRRIVLAIVQHGQMTLEQVRLVFFQKENGELASRQAVGRRLRLLVARRYLRRVRLTAACGSGPFVYLPDLGAKGLLPPDQHALVRGRSNPRASSLWHGLETVDVHIAIRQGLESHGGRIETWLGEVEARYQFDWHGRRLTLTPDAYCLWSYDGLEGSFFLELDRGTESMQRLAQKLARYGQYYSCDAHVDHLGNLGLKPRILFVVPDDRRRDRMVRWLASRRGTPSEAALPTILMAVRDDVLNDGLAAVWYRAGRSEPTRFVD